MAWAAIEIKGTEYESYFAPDGKPTRGWYQGWLRRMDFLTGHLRPLEQTREEWYTEKNLETYFDIARDVFLNAGVAVMNPTFDPSEPYSEELNIVAPDRICSYDETRVELDCTDPSKGLTDRIVRAGPKDDGTSLVTKSSKTASAVCGRLGDGRAMPVYTVFNSVNSFEPSWTPSIVSDCIFDKDGKGLPWRYSSNEKGSVNEDFCKEYIEEILWPSLGYPKSRDSHLGQQGVVICDGDGTHLAYSVVKRAIELGLEIVLRVPHLSWVLQGEDTVNFKVFLILQCFMYLL